MDGSFSLRGLLVGPRFHLNSSLLWFTFGWYTIRNFSVGPVLSIGPFQKIQREMIYFSYAATKNKLRPQIVQKS